MARRTAWGAYAHIANALRQRITDGIYAPGDQLPGEAALCAEFGVARNTVRRALSTLETDGLITARPGVGRFVPTAKPAVHTRYESIAADLRRHIRSGHYRPGDLLPSEAQLAKRYGVSRHTARHALTALEEAGLVTCIHGKGRYASQDVPR
ncbi:MAG TPA: winged helix-turn-helix domain-containing protein [Spirillospora sp.]|nr:winged helix-turn-helix domain-containing protein [Spirillospora sp.]